MTKDQRRPKVKKPVKAYSLDQLLPNAGNSTFLLVRLAMLRSVEIHFGSPPLVEHASSEKETTIALREIAQGKVVAKVGKKEGQEDCEDVLQTPPIAVSKVENAV